MDSLSGEQGQTDLPKQLEQYLSHHGILVQLNNLVNELLRNQPLDPFAYMIEFLGHFTTNPSGPASGADGAKVARLEADLKAANDRAEKLASEMADVKAQLRAASDSSSSGKQELMNKIAELDAQRRKASDALTAALSEGSAAAARFDKLFAENQRLSQEAAQQKGKVGNLGARLRPMKAQCAALKKMIADTRKETQRLMSKEQSGPTIQAMLKPVKDILFNYDREVKRVTDLYRKEMTQRKDLYNQLQELKGNIRVYCRVRPLSSAEKQHDSPSNITFPEEDTLAVGVGASRKAYEFDHVYTPESTQESIFADTKPLVTSVVDGYNVCIFAYGQTGSGKTHTMEGPEGDRGVNYRALNELFAVCEARKEEYDCEIVISMVEVYNETIRDLLAEPRSKAELSAPGYRAPPSLEIRQGPDGNYVPDLSSFEVTSTQHIYDIIQMGGKNRSTFATNMNEHSSRSHCVLMVKVTTRNKKTGVRALGKVNLVDLAGSERISKSEAVGDRLKEAQAINKSLSALGDVIHSLSTSNPHIPYRNSKLTYLLQDSLGGHSKVLMFLQISPAEEHKGETGCSLAFGQRVRGVELGKATKTVDHSAPDSADLARAQSASATAARKVATTPTKAPVTQSKSRGSIPLDRV